jgi:hypothetical protein
LTKLTGGAGGGAWSVRSDPPEQAATARVREKTVVRHASNAPRLMESSVS